MRSPPPWLAALDHERLPAAIVDLDAFDANLATLAGVVGNQRIRVATKSVRCAALLGRARDTLGEQWGGLMAVSPHEAAHLAAHGFHDILVAYPVARGVDAAPVGGLVTSGVDVRLMVDCAAHVDVAAEMARDVGAVVSVVIDVDVSWRPGGGLHLGVRRSPVREARQALALAAHIESRDGVRLDGIMAYEAQVAGLADHSGSWSDPVKRHVKRVSIPLARRRRAEVVAALTDAGHAVHLVNGGGTGSVRSTSEDPTITELTVGSGLLAPHLFDGYDGLALEPAAFAALPVVRRSDAHHVTVHGGGYVASGAAGPDRCPRVAWPAGLTATRTEGWGEVQTPLREPTPGSLHPGDVVLVRHAKSGELLAHFSRVLLARGGAVVDRATTWRGEGVDLG